MSKCILKSRRSEIQQYQQVFEFTNKTLFLPKSGVEKTGKDVIFGRRWMRGWNAKVSISGLCMKLLYLIITEVISLKTHTNRKMAPRNAPN